MCLNFEIKAKEIAVVPSLTTFTFSKSAIKTIKQCVKSI